jgi:hypothetical protein
MADDRGGGATKKRKQSVFSCLLSYLFRYQELENKAFKYFIRMPRDIGRLPGVLQEPLSEQNGAAGLF